MNQVHIFLLLALGLALWVAGLLVWSVKRAASAQNQGHARHQVMSHVSVYRDQLAELDQELASGALDAEGHALSKEELTQRLLEDAPTPTHAESPKAVTRVRGLMAMLLLAFPLLGMGLYFFVGTPMALDPAWMSHANGDEPITPEKLEAMAVQLDQQLSQEPNNAEAWVMLGRVQRALGRYDQADASLQKSLALARNNDVLVERAEVLAQKNQGSFKGEPWAILLSVLKNDPQNGNALLLAGSAAFSEERFKDALGYWEKVRALLPPSSPDLPALAEAIDKARERLGLPPQAPLSANNAPASAGVIAPSNTNGSERLTGRVSLAPSLASQVSPKDTVFIYATATEGPRMPLAVVRTTVDRLPYDFVLDDSLAMNPQMTLSKARSVMVRARISKTGNAMPQAGDWGVSIGPIAPGSSQKLQLTIAQPLNP